MTTKDNTTKPELLPCPFCGGKVIEAIPHFNQSHAECERCGAEWGYCGSKYSARYEKWNRRA